MGDAAPVAKPFQRAAGAAVQVNPDERRLPVARHRLLARHGARLARVFDDIGPFAVHARLHPINTDRPGGTSEGGADAAIRSASARARSRIAGGTSGRRSEEHTSELQSLMRISYAVFCLKKKHKTEPHNAHTQQAIKRIRL